MNDGDIKVISNKFKWKYLRRGKVNLLVYGEFLADPTLSKSKKIILQDFGQTAFFKSIIFYFLNKNEIKT